MSWLNDLLSHQQKTEWRMVQVKIFALITLVTKACSWGAKNIDPSVSLVNFACCSQCHCHLESAWGKTSEQNWLCKAFSSKACKWQSLIWALNNWGFSAENHSWDEICWRSGSADLLKWYPKLLLSLHIVVVVVIIIISATHHVKCKYAWEKRKF